MTMQHYKKFLCLLISQQILGSLSFFTYFVVIRLIFGKEPVKIKNLMIYLNFISNKLIKIFIKKLARKNIIVPYFKNSSKTILNLNLQEFFFQSWCKKQIFFPLIKKNYQDKFFISNSNRSSFFMDFKRNEFKEILNFLCNKLDDNVSKPGFQIVLFLKTTNLIENACNENGLKVTRLGTRALFREYENRVYETTEDLLRNFFSYFLYKKYLWSGCYKVNSKVAFLENLFKPKEISTKEVSMNDLINRIKEKNDKKANLTHGFFENFMEYAMFYRETKTLFFPCLADNIFYLHPCMWKNIKTKNLFRNRINVNKNFSAQHFQIIIETNYRIYAYKKTFFKNDILLVFSEMLFQLPNLFVGEITERSIHRAKRIGVSSINIIGFLKRNLHALCPVIPFVVLNQIRTWDLQKKRVYITDSLLFICPENQNKIFMRKKLLKWQVNHTFSFDVNNLYALKETI